MRATPLKIVYSYKYQVHMYTGVCIYGLAALVLRCHYYQSFLRTSTIDLRSLLIQSLFTPASVRVEYP